MTKRSAGLLIYRRSTAGLEVLLVHPGGPFWSRKDDGAWSIPKGLIETGEDELAAAKREVAEELGLDIDGKFDFLGEYKQSGGKIVVVWAVEPGVEIDAGAIKSNSFEIEWPPRSGKNASFPEVDRAGWFSPDEAQRKILKGQADILTKLQGHLTSGQ